jgi:cell division protein FtsW
MFRKVGERATVRDDRTARRRYQAVVIGSVPSAMAVERNPSRTEKSARSNRLVQLKVDVPLVLALIALMVLGLIILYSASYDYSYFYYKGDGSRIFTRQLTWMGLGSVALLGMMFVNYHIWRKLAVVGMVVTLGALVLVLALDLMLNNAVRTLIKGSIQPSELAKLMMVIYLSVWLHAKRDQLHQLSFGLIPLGGILGITGSLILLQPDLSATITVVMLGVLMFFLAGAEMRQMLILLVVGLAVGFVVINLNPTGSTRITEYWAGLQDPTNGSYQIRRSFEAFVRGGWVGLGVGNSETKLTGLPVPPTDSIFAVVGEETGVMGCLGLLGLYSVVLWRGMRIAFRAPDQMGMLLAAGATLWLSMEAFINMAVMVNILPFAGNALPFVSAGGSSLVTSMAAMGLILNVSRSSEMKKEGDGKLFHAVVNLRGGDRRGRVSGNSRVASPAEPVRRSERPRR